MKNIAKLVLFGSFCFIILFIFLSLFQFLSLWIDVVRGIPVRPNALSGALVLAGQWAVPGTLYVSILFCLSYAARQKIRVPASIFCIFILSSVFTLALTLGMDQIRKLRPALENVKTPPGEPGLILAQGETAIILLKPPGDIGGPRVVSIPGEALRYQEIPLGPQNRVIALPALPFRNEIPWVFKSLLIDFNLSAREFDSRFQEGLIPFGIYGGALILLLACLRFILDFGKWPLANIFLGALAFRGILALETFLNTREINAFLEEFLGNRVPGPFITPLVFCSLVLILLLYMTLAYLGWGRKGEEDV
ncbi:MAG: hypothetical protein LBL43_03940 [Treponema sp.]|jgi:hypothetical protein|nr:hypothetical protein [Treponema sp.]